MIHTSTRNADTIATAMERGEDFRTSGALRGESTSNGYRVFSYAAIIAERDENGHWTMADRKWSQTTTQHQNVVRSALRMNGVTPAMV